MRGPRGLLVSCLILVIISPINAATARPSRMATGTWGGEHIRIMIEGGSAAVEYDCARGTLTLPLNVDSKGRFSWRGFYSEERGGPVRQDQQPNNQPALYIGRVVGNKMTLRVNLVKTNEVIGTYTLKKDGGGNLVKCR